jgi:defect-in-organelle-trafficking protein DotB
MESVGRYPHESAGIITPAEFDEILVWAAANGASDVKLAPGRPIWARFHGVWKLITNHVIQGEEIAALLNHTARTHAAHGHVTGGSGDFDYHYDIITGRGERRRFRANATACNDDVQTGVEITLRTIEPDPPSVKDISTPEEIVGACLPQNGIVLVTGKMGSGKSTTIAALLRLILETEPRSVATYESPIEYDLSGVENIGPLSQSEIPRQFPSFASAGRNATRRATDVALVGESRDRETMRSALELAEIGSAVYTTVHTMTVAQTPARIINMFDPDERQMITATLFSAVRAIVHQRLLPKVGGGRVAIYEWLFFDRALGEALATAPIHSLTDRLSAIVDEQGRSLLVDAREKFEAGLIEEQDFKHIEAERAMRDEQHVEGQHVRA